METIALSIQNAMLLADRLAPLKKRYVQAVLVSCIADMSTGRMSLSEQDALGNVWRDGGLLVNTILALGLADNVPTDDLPALRERAEVQRYLLDPAFVVQPWFAEEEE